MGMLDDAKALLEECNDTRGCFCCGVLMRSHADDCKVAKWLADYAAGKGEMRISIADATEDAGEEAYRWIWVNRCVSPHLFETKELAVKHAQKFADSLGLTLKEETDGS